MKIFIVAAAAWAAGALLGYFVARLAYKHLRKRLRTLRQERKPPKKKMGTMDRILVLEAVFLVAYTVADLVVFWHTGSEPATLTGCVFGVCGLENGVMGWIKTNKDKQQDRKWAEEDRQRMEREAQQPADFEPSFTAEQKNRNQ